VNDNDDVGVLAEELSDLKSQGPRQCFGVVTGVVVSVADPLPLGRVRVRVPSIDSIEPLPWARVATPMAGFTGSLPHGAYFAPQMGTEVLVAFENGDLDSPYVIGSLWNASAPPPVPSPLTQMRMIRTPLGNQIMLTDVPPSISITGPSMVNGLRILDGGPAMGVSLQLGTNTILLTPEGIVLQAGGAAIKLGKEGVTITGLAVRIAGAPFVYINSPG
jgi:hypothetical protein